MLWNHTFWNHSENLGNVTKQLIISNVLKSSDLLANQIHWWNLALKSESEMMLN